LGLNPDVDFCPQPKIPTRNDKRMIHFSGLFILDLSILHEISLGFLLSRDS